MSTRIIGLLLIIGWLSPLNLSAQATEIHHRVKVNLVGHTVFELARLGLETDHGEYAPGKHLINDFSESALRRLLQAGFEYTILIEDVGDFYTNRERRLASIAAEARGGGNCGPSDGVNYPYTVPENFDLGTLSGFYRYQEMLDVLDEMRAMYPNLISSRQVVDPGITTHEGRPIYWLRISDNPDTDETTEPEVLYTALHHAREPNSLTQMIFFMWYVLENYETDPEVNFLVNNTELYFMPCLNPDGYIFNETTDPNGGGFWRKNRRNNGDGSFGVDLNRNYGYEWAHDDFGSSPNPSSDVYRGPGPFSEPETRAVQAFCNDHEFVAALNYHTFGNLLIYPWGFSDSPTPEAQTFNTIADIMTTQNSYFAGTGTETVGYVVNGDSDDWMYGETNTKPAIYSMTPEVGQGGFNGGFWPVQEDIIPNSLASIWMNLVQANIPHNAGVARPDPIQSEINLEDLEVRFSIQRFGLADGSLTVSLTSEQPDDIIVAEEPKVYNLDRNQSVSDAFQLALVNTELANNTPVNFILTVDNGEYTRSETISLIYGNFVEAAIVEEDFANLDNWQASGDWGLTDEDFVSAPNSLTDSPYTPHDNNTFSTVELNDAITVGAAEEYRLQFWAKWEIEATYDFAMLQFSVNDGPWVAGCGRYTTLGTDNQLPGEPLWDGFQEEWVEEEINLSDFLSEGDELRLRFVFFSDQFVTFDGFYADDITLIERGFEVVSTQELMPEQFTWQVVPNPSRGQTTLRFQSALAQNVSGNWELLHTDGRQLRKGMLTFQAGQAEATLSTVDLPVGIYIVRAQVEGQYLPAQRLVVAR